VKLNIIAKNTIASQKPGDKSGSGTGTATERFLKKE
jgi:hypothetical protein